MHSSKTKKKKKHNTHKTHQNTERDHGGALLARGGRTEFFRCTAPTKRSRKKRPKETQGEGFGHRSTVGKEDERRSAINQGRTAAVKQERSDGRSRLLRARTALQTRNESLLKGKREGAAKKERISFQVLNQRAKTGGRGETQRHCRTCARRGPSRRATPRLTPHQEEICLEPMTNEKVLIQKIVS